MIPEIRRELKQNIDAKTRSSFQRFFKENVLCYGVKTAAVTGIARMYFKSVKPLGKKQVFALCEELLKSDYMEEAFIAFDWAYRFKDDFVPGDFPLFQSWLENYVNNWAKCDVFCNHTLGSFIEKYPDYLQKLKKWTKSNNRWLRRASAVTLIVPAKRGKFLADVFEIADSLLLDEDDLVQKGYGWLLKEASRLHQQEVFDFVMKNKDVMPRTALRYAIEKMPPELRRRAMAKD
jgi:3-methyladenine DNA glycosylase AlkD